MHKAHPLDPSVPVGWGLSLPRPHAQICVLCFSARSLHAQTFTPLPALLPSASSGLSGIISAPLCPSGKPAIV